VQTLARASFETPFRSIRGTLFRRAGQRTSRGLFNSGVRGCATNARGFRPAIPFFERRGMLANPDCSNRQVKR
jgi:hypothetical protein